MNHSPPPVVNRADWRGLIQRVRLWLHLRLWTYGRTARRKARRNGFTGEIQYEITPGYWSSSGTYFWPVFTEDARYSLDNTHDANTLPPTTHHGTPQKTD